MDKVVFDTDIFSEITKGRNLSVEKHKTPYFSKWGYYTITVFTMMEIIKGFQLRPGMQHRLEQFLQELSNIEVLPFGEQGAHLGGKIIGDLERTGQPIGKYDPLIAAIAIVHGITLATGNSDHFERIQKLGYPLRLENWKE